MNSFFVETVRVSNCNIVEIVFLAARIEAVRFYNATTHGLEDRYKIVFQMEDVSEVSVPARWL